MYSENARDYWQYIWDREDVYRLQDDVADPTYVLGMFPYTSGTLHMGHVRNYTITDAYARYRRLQGDDVLHPMGWDAFGLPAENAAYERYTDPESWTRSCISRMRDEMRSMGFGYDWHREVTTCDPSYYRWNQWFFKRFYEAGLVEYRAATVNWCPDCETSLADAQVEETAAGRVCWRCETPVTHRELDQWFFTITDYADELHDGLNDLIAWPNSVREIQRNWIGRQEGVSVTFPTDTGTSVDVFTTRLDTIFGATFVAISPRHDIAISLAESDQTVAKYLEEWTPGASHTAGTAGVRTSASATHPLTDEKLPIYVADYVLDDVGTGAVMGVPAHNRRDFDFATAHDIPITSVIDSDSTKSDSPPYTDDGILIDSGKYTGLESAVARNRLASDLESVEALTTYRLRDWLISRQRYWGTPIPVIHCPECGPILVPDEDLPVELPEFVQTTGNPLESIEGFVDADCPACGRSGRRETDTMDTFVDSSWYFLRFLSPSFDDAPFDIDRANSWLPIDVYVGGEEHAILHLLYIRFFTKALADLGYLDIREPVDKLVNHGMVLYEGEKMSTARGNVVGPHEYGAETTRLFLLAGAHPERDFEWTAKDVGSAYDFQQMLYRMTDEFMGPQSTVRSTRSIQDDYLEWMIDGTIATVAADYDSFRFHNAIGEIRRLYGAFRRYQSYEPPHKTVFRDGLLTIARLIAPITPFLGEELWNILRGEGIVTTASWPETTTDPEIFRLERGLVRSTREDVRDIIDIIDIESPDRIEITVAPAWKFQVYEHVRTGNRDDDLTETIQASVVDDIDGEAVSDYVGTLLSEGTGLEPVLDGAREVELLRQAAWLMMDEFGAEVSVSRATPDDEVANRAEPNRPAIQID